MFFCDVTLCINVSGKDFAERKGSVFSSTCIILPFCFVNRLNSIDYKDLKDKVSSPVLNARNVVIQQSMTERFLVAFRQQVDSNPTYSLPEGSPVRCTSVSFSFNAYRWSKSLTEGMIFNDFSSFTGCELLFIYILNGT